jgi:PAS domain S-box-containing protein
VSELNNGSPAWLESLFQDAPIGVAYFDRGLRYVRVNEKLAEINGVPADEHVGRTVGEVLPDMDPRASELFERVLATGQPALDVEFVGRTRNVPEDEPRQISASLYPVRDASGAITGIGVTALDVTPRRRAEAARERALDRARLIAEASAMLDQSLDYQSTLRNMSRLMVPRVADWCAIDVTEPDDTLRRVSEAGTDPGPSDPSRSVVVPMIARGRTLGTITLRAAETGRSYDDEDRLLAEELAGRAAMSIDNSRLYAERSYIARTLQQSLLPPHLPDIPGLDVAARYRPAGEGNQVGGDFYDVFSMGGESWAVVIGDVCGKGADAAALTALVRYTVRALATADKLPSEVLRLLNDAILRQRSDSRFSTVAYARVVPPRAGAGARVELASGGHPLPLLVRADGHAEATGRPGTLLGVVPDPTLFDVAVDLGPGDALVLYTDGVTEAGAPHKLMEPDDLAAAIGDCDERDAAGFATCLERMAVDASGGDPHDDIAIVVLRVPPLQPSVSDPPNTG